MAAIASAFCSRVAVRWERHRRPSPWAACSWASASSFSFADARSDRVSFLPVVIAANRSSIVMAVKLADDWARCRVARASKSGAGASGVPAWGVVIRHLGCETGRLVECGRKPLVAPWCVGWEGECALRIVAASGLLGRRRS